MSLPVVIRVEAEQDLLAASDWYDRHGTGLGDVFAAGVADVAEQISEMPRLFGLVWRDVRVCRLKRFPYVVHYQVFDDRVEILAVLHTGRDPSTWQSRL